MTTTLTVQAVITAVDRLTGPLRGMAQQVGAISGTFQKAGAAATAFGAASGLAAAGAMQVFAGVAAAGREELDRALRHFQAMGAATDEQRIRLETMIMDMAPRLGMGAMQLIEGATNLVQAGFEVSEILDTSKVQILEMIATAAKGAGESIDEMATSLIALGRQFNMPWDTAEDKAETIRRFLGLAAFAPQLSPDTFMSHIRGLTRFGGLAYRLGLRPEEASALQSLMAIAGYKGAEGGNALSAILTRFITPTPAARQWMRQAGFDYHRVMQLDLSRIRDADALISGLETGLGMDLSKHRAWMARNLAKITPETDIFRFQDWMAEQLGNRLGLKKGDVIKRGIIRKGIQRFFTAGGAAINVVALLEEMAKLPVDAFKDFAGLHRLKQAQVLALQENLKVYADLLRRIEEGAPGAEQRMAGPKLEGYAYQLDRLRASIESLRSAMWNAGFGNWMEKLTKRFADFADSLRQIDPAVLNGIAKALTTLGAAGAGLAAAGAAIWAIGGALSAFGALATSPFWGPVIAAGGLAAYLFGDDFLSLFKVKTYDPFGTPISPAGEFLNELKATFDKIGDAFKSIIGFGGELIGILEGVGRSVANLFGMDLTNSPLMRGFVNFGNVMGEIRANAEYIEGLFNSLTASVRGEETAPRLPDPNSFWGRYELLGRMLPHLLGTEAAPQPQSAPAPAQPVEPVQTGWLDAIKSLFQSQPPPVAKLEGAGTVNVNIKVDGPGKVMSTTLSDDGKNIKLKTGESNPDVAR